MDGRREGQRGGIPNEIGRVEGRRERGRGGIGKWSGRGSEGAGVGSEIGLVLRRNDRGEQPWKFADFSRHWRLTFAFGD